MEKEENLESSIEVDAEISLQDEAAIGFERELGAFDDENDFTPKPELSESELGEQLKNDAQAQAIAKQEQEMAQMSAAFLMESYEETMKSLVGQEFQLSDAMKQKASEKYAPLIIKYGPAALSLFGQYKDEFMAGVFTVGLIKESMSQIRAIKPKKPKTSKPQQAETNREVSKSEAD